jgi:hypothetical protein
LLPVVVFIELDVDDSAIVDDSAVVDYSANSTPPEAIFSDRDIPGSDILRNRREIRKRPCG